MPFRPDRPYNDLPPLPPREDVETKAVLKACIEARAALAELRISGQLIPNQAVLINSIPLLEAQASSEIENIVTTTDRLFRFANEAGNHADPATKEALRYRTALSEGFQSLKQRPVSTSTAITVCQTIKGFELDIRATPGTALMNETTGSVIYTPPEGQALLRDKLANWERYIHEAEDIDPLIRLAVMHYQFEAIHPFIDGNGRTGRVLNLLFLVDKGLLDIPVLYLSRYIIGNKRAYYDRLLAVTTQEEWEDWILYILEAVRETANWSTARIRAIRDLLDQTAEHIRRDLPKIYSRELAEVIFVNPYCRIGDLVTAGIAKRQAASVYLKALTELGLLQEMKAGRENLYINPALLALLSEQRPARHNQ
ncbi:Fic family protein [Hoeflea sp. EC-HK425]|uniref:protein adenylyltransferase Fic n=1 Tax=Hoeflea sp. EC-HK425 TaxID=2038388 RepID=UPI00125FCFE3|nr:Fic family protein [Hoeflea sp. EC-HK425]